jgi:hypothetical protein
MRWPSRRARLWAWRMCGRRRGRTRSYCFVCTPRHATYRNLVMHPQFTVSFPRSEQVLAASLAAGRRFEGTAGFGV